jgi:formylglycine-generating enzyme required for sulfatase activity
MNKMYVVKSLIASACTIVVTAGGLWANAVNVTKARRLDPPNRDLIAFELSWQNSWNVLGPPANHDAVWVFIKFRPCTTGAKWSHALLQTTGSTPPYENGTDHTLHADLTLATPILTTDRLGNAGAHNTGAMIRRKHLGTGHISHLPCTLKVVGASAPATWSNSVDYDIRVVAIEMVQVKSGPFYLGDSTSYQSFMSYTGCVKTSYTCYDWWTWTTTTCPCTPPCVCYDNCSNSYWNPDAATCASIIPPLPPPLIVNSETSPLTVYLKSNYYSWSFNPGPHVLPANYPKGVNEFYVMKYEISQGQYADFLNTIDWMVTPDPFTCYENYTNTPVPCPCTACWCVENGWYGQPVSPTTCKLITPKDIRHYNTTSYRRTISFSGGKYVAAEPNRACNYLSYDDVLSYLDWAALRPMTELEYEKACRGPLPYVYGEYPWGSAANRVEAINITSPENGSEICTDLNANLHFSGSNTNVVVGTSSSAGPLGVGIFARDTTQKRVSTGAGYYGAMELGGNVREVTIGIRGACSNVSCYTGVWGDGLLDSNQRFNAPLWPAATPSYQLFSYRGGGWNDHQDRCRVSDREHYEWIYNFNDRYESTGGRGCR